MFIVLATHNCAECQRRWWCANHTSANSSHIDIWLLMLIYWSIKSTQHTNTHRQTNRRTVIRRFADYYKYSQRNKNNRKKTYRAACSHESATISRQLRNVPQTGGCGRRKTPLYADDTRANTSVCSTRSSVYWRVCGVGWVSWIRITTPQNITCLFWSMWCLCSSPHMTANITRVWIGFFFWLVASHAGSSNRVCYRLGVICHE